MQPNGTTRRAHRRRPAELRVDWWRDGTATHYVSTTKDLSDGGVYVATVSAAEVGAKVRLRFSSGGGPVEIAGTVVHCVGGTGMGVRVDRQRNRGRGLGSVLLV